MRELRTEIVIHAPPEHVWALLTDFDGMPDWNPYITEISGPLSEGERIRVHLRPSDSGGMTFRPKLVRVEPGRELRWQGHLVVPGLFDGEHIFELVELSEGRTRFVHREEFRGVLSGLLLRSLADDTLGGFSAMNQALKAGAEATG